MSNVVYNSAKQKIMDGSIDLDTDTIKIALVTSSYTPNQDDHEDYADLTNEVTGTGYTAGGATLTNTTITKDNANNRGVFDADDVTWTTATITARGAVIYKDSGVDSTSWLITYKDFGADITSTASDFDVLFSTDGIIYLS